MVPLDYLGPKALRADTNDATVRESSPSVIHHRGAMSESTMVAEPEVAANALVEQHLYLVQHVLNQLASRYPRHIDRTELWSAGAAGLVEASRRYDAATGVPFPRFARIRIRGAMIDSTRMRDWATRGVRRGLREVSDGTRTFEERNGRAPSSRELAASLGISAEELARRHAAAQTATLLHLDQPLAQSDTSESTLGEWIAESDETYLPEESLERVELSGTVRNAVEHLPEVQREVVQRYFFDGELLRDIAASMGVTEARVSQIRAEALHALQAYFGSAYEGVPEVPPSAPGMRHRAAYVATMQAESSWRARLEAGAAAAEACSA